jgi:hypothetical protein
MKSWLNTLSKALGIKQLEVASPKKRAEIQEL